MEGHSFLLQRRTSLLSEKEVFRKQVLHGIGTEPPSMNVGK
jgi:hypothetical protein